MWLMIEAEGGSGQAGAAGRSAMADVGSALCSEEFSVAHKTETSPHLRSTRCSGTSPRRHQTRLTANRARPLCRSAPTA